MIADTGDTGTGSVDLDRCVAPGCLTPVYQPVVDLDSDEVIGYESLARWPGMPGLDPGTVFRAARRAGRVADVDWACRKAALRGALSGGLDDGSLLFVNIESDVTGLPSGAEAMLLFAQAHTRFRVVAELTETALVDDPPRLFKLISWIRKIGWSVALDDVGAHSASLALLPIVAPDVIKLDMSIVQAQPGIEQARIASAVMAQAERTDALIVAEGIETPAHRDHARSLGATLGQGWLLGRPQPAAEHPLITTQTITLSRPPRTEQQTPFALLDHDRPSRIGNRHLLRALSQHIESQVLTQPDTVTLLAAFQHASRFTPAIAARYAALAQRSPLITTLAHRMSPWPAPGVHGIALLENDPLCDEWTVIAVGAHYTAALLARYHTDDDTPAHDRYKFVITHNRDLAITAAQLLLARTQPNYR